MSTQTILENGTVSPSTRAFLKTTNSIRSILKRPNSNTLLPSPMYQLRSSSSASKAAVTDPDSRLPKVQPGAKQATIRFATPFLSAPKSLAKSLSLYPRSPFPSAPHTPIKAVAKDCSTGDIVHRARAQSLEVPKRSKRNMNKKGLTLAPVLFSMPPSSSLGHSGSSVDRIHGPDSESPDESLSQFFWQTTPLGEAEVVEIDSECPISAVEYEGQMEMDTRTPQSKIMYASANGALWSPRPATSLNKIRDSLMSPSKRGVVRKDITAPTPYDPFAAFPSFTAASEMGSSESSIPKLFWSTGFRRGE